LLIENNFNQFLKNLPPKKNSKLLKIAAKPPRLPAFLAALRAARKKIRSSYIQYTPPVFN